MLLYFFFYSENINFMQLPNSFFLLKNPYEGIEIVPSLVCVLTRLESCRLHLLHVVQAFHV